MARTPSTGAVFKTVYAARTATPNEAPMAAQATRPDTFFGSRRPSVALTTKPRNGRSGISSSTRSPLQARELVRVERFPGPEERDHDRQPDRGFRRCHRHHEEHDDLSVHRLPVLAGGDEREIDGVEHHLDREEDGDEVAPEEH